MQTLFNPKAPKKPTNLSVNSDLLLKSKELNINLSATLEAALKEKLAENSAKEWSQQNRRSIQSYNRYVEQNGLFADKYRTF